MYKTTTPTITLQFPTTSADLTTLGICIVTLRQANIRYDLSSEDNEVTITAHAVSFSLTQQQTQAFAVDDFVRVQANFVDASGNRVPSNICRLEVMENLHGELILND